jgi:hypothetical protein
MDLETKLPKANVEMASHKIANTLPPEVVGTAFSVP